MGHGNQPPVVHTVTSAQTSSSDDQPQRIRRYLTMMGIRIACFGLVFVTSGWLRWVEIVAAVVLPYFAVVIANAVRPREVGHITPVTEEPDKTKQIDQ
ncbi:MAG: DUF3099 domain-containing protein [Intrasporangium sp.]|uniref:DUF3099 domain-containing protein n=1 Tax=Intrasporangium sp. TaxID=1925024 RepID=UPI0026471093|nr:DUF3099 domain-containing protein [Intrasporangium sp.]MDN5796297.1 DUF3099 domain-containing protein [Intrasporangium sp.]